MTKLEFILRYTVDNISFYRYLRNEKISLRRFPISDKYMIRNNLSNLYTGDLSRSVEIKTSGSSGVQGTTYISKVERWKLRFVQLRWWYNSGWRPWLPSIQTGMTFPRSRLKSFKDFVFRVEYLSAFDLTEQSLSECLQKYVDKQVFLAGYASSLAEIANVAKTYSYRLNITGVVSWGDKMFESYERTIHQAFKVKVSDTYASSEGFMIAYRPAGEQIYRVMTNYVVLELLDDKGVAVEIGEIGQVVVTSLIHKKMPMIRYRLGDLAIGYERNSEGYYTALSKIIGRSTDVIMLSNGNKLIVHFFTAIFEHYEAIQQFQVVDKGHNKIIIRFISDKSNIDELLVQIEDIIMEKSGSSLSIEWQKVEFIANSPSGKPEIIVSDK